MVLDGLVILQNNTKLFHIDSIIGSLQIIGVVRLFPSYSQIFHAKMGSIKDRNGMDLTEAEDIKRRGKNTQKNCTKQIFMTQVIMIV